MNFIIWCVFAFIFIIVINFILMKNNKNYHKIRYVVTVKLGSVPVRKKPNKHSKIIGHINSEDKFISTRSKYSSNEKWYYIDFLNGWVSSKQVSIKEVE